MTTYPHLPCLQISDNQRFLVTEDGHPFFWLADTAWELLHRLNREDTEYYLHIRAAQGFNVIQTVALAELDGLRTPNAYGRLPLLNNNSGLPDPLRPDLTGEYSYWQHVDEMIRLAASLGMYTALLPTWGDKFHKMWGRGPEIFTPDNAFEYGKWLGERYRQTDSLIWVLGGDRPLQTRRHFEIIRQMALGIREGDGGRHLMTFHPKGGVSSSLYVHEEEWLDWNMIQSSHGAGVRENYRLIENDYHLRPIKPTLDAEPCYEDIPIDFKPENGYFDEVDVRQAAYYAVFSGAAGHTYGHHSVWALADGLYSSVAMDQPGAFFIMSWQDALQRPGARQMQHLRHLMESVDYTTGQPAQELLQEPLTGANTPVATRGKNYIFIYCPQGLYVKVRLGELPGTELTASWYCPRTGQHTGQLRIPNTGTRRFTAPSSGRGRDWVLCLYSGSKE
ncbi:glycoside hydrolase family 140 protein [Paenibacillus sp. Z6-24]